MQLSESTHSVLWLQKDLLQYNCTAGVSNFSLQQLIELQQWATVPPAVMQRHADVFNQDHAVHRYCASQGIQYVAFSSLGTQYLNQALDSSPVLTNGAVQTLAAKRNATPAQVRPLSARAPQPCSPTGGGYMASDAGSRCH